jgi:hypothetical protein
MNVSKQFVRFYNERSQIFVLLSLRFVEQNDVKYEWISVYISERKELVEQTSKNVGFEVSTAVIMKSTIFCDITPCSVSSVNGRFGETYRPPAGLLLNLFFDPEDGGDMFLQNVGCNSTDYTASYRRRWYSSYI